VLGDPTDRHGRRASGTRRATESVWSLRSIWWLTGVMAAATVPLLFWLHQLSPLSKTPAPFVLLLVLFLAVEALRVEMEIGASSHTVTMSEVGLVVGVLTARPFDTVVAQMVAVLIVFGVVRRLPPIKVLFNLVEVGSISSIGVLVMLAFRPGTDISVRAAMGGLAAGLLVGVLNLGAVSSVTRMAGQLLDRSEVTRTLVYASSSSVASAAIGVQMVFLGRQSVWLVTLAAVPVALLYAAFRSYAGQRRAADRSELLHQAAIALHDAPNLDDGLLAVLEFTRAAARAEFARVVLSASEGAVTVLAHHDPTQQVSMSAASRELSAAAQLLTYGLEGAALIDDDDAAAHALLGVLDVEAGVAVPLRRNGERAGLLVVANRLGDFDEFRRDDVRLVELVANQIGVALEKGRLEQSIRQLIELETKLHHQANHDGLTGVANRRLFNERVEALFAQRPPSGVALILIDLDDFKQVNDSHGHVVGDEILSIVAQRLHAGVRSGDLVARIGGDEFALVIQGVDSQATAMQRASAIVDAVGKPVRLHDRVLTVQTSIGVALVDSATRSPGDLLRNADTALYRAKALGKDGYVLFEPNMHSEADERRVLAADIAEAVHRRQFTVVYLALHDLVSGEIVGVEALVRWKHPRHGAMLPGQFLEIAGEIGLVVELGEQVMTQAIHDIAGITNALPGGRPIRLSLNVSAQEISNAGLVPHLVASLRSAGFPPERLVLEATEGGFLANAEGTRAMVRQLIERGIHLALDDFGVGYSALSHVHELPFDELKIDGSLVATLGRDDRTSALVGSIVHFANALEITAVAEGIETHEQLVELRRRGCRFGQGYLMSSPMTVDELTKVLTDPRAARPAWAS